MPKTRDFSGNLISLHTTNKFINNIKYVVGICVLVETLRWKIVNRNTIVYNVYLQFRFLLQFV